MILAIALSSVLSVDIETSSSFQGHTYGPRTVHIVRSGSDFVSNGVSVSSDAVQKLIDALSAPALNQPTPEALQISGAALETLEPAAMQECSGVSATQAAQDAYRQRFTDATVFSSFLRAYYAKPPTPGAGIPTLRITVTSSDGQVTATSSSSKAGMLPFTVARDGATATTYDASLPRAAGALLPPSGTSMMLQLDGLDGEWSASVCDDDMTTLAFRDALPQTFAFAQEHGLVLHGSVRGNPIDSVTATLGRADNPRIGMLYNADVRGGDAASVMALQSSSNVLHRIATIPWLQKTLAARPAATVNIDDPSMTGNFLEAYEVKELRDAGFARAASLLAANFANAPSFWVWLKPDKEASQWYLLPNGDALLVHYLPAEVSLPFDPQTNARIFHRGKPFLKGPTITVGSIVTPAGTLEP